MVVLKYRNKMISGDDESTLNWTERPTSDDLLVEVFETEELFRNLSTHWQDLTERADATVYMSYEWAYNWWQNFGKNKQRSLCLVTFWDGTKLVALAPFYKGYSKFGPFVLERRLQLIGSGGSPSEQYGYTDDYGISDFLDIIVDPAYYKVVANRMLDILTQELLEVDVVKFHQAGDDSFVVKYLYPELQEQGAETEFEQTDTCPYINVHKYATLKEYIADQKSNARRRLRQTVRAINSDDEGYVIEDLESWDEVEKATETIIKLHQDRWNRLGFTGVFYDERFTRFFKNTIKYAFDNGWLWFKQARDSQGICASRMILFYNGRYYDYISGFDELRPSSKYRPGIGLLIEVVKEAIENGTTRVELLRGEEGYKYDFTDQNFNNWKLEIPLREKRWNPLLLMNRIAAFLYKRVGHELRLLNVQRQQVGILKMFWDYFSFRLTSVKLKLKSD